MMPHEDKGKNNVFSMQKWLQKLLEAKSVMAPYHKITRSTINVENFITVSHMTQQLLHNAALL